MELGTFTHTKCSLSHDTSALSTTRSLTTSFTTRCTSLTWKICSWPWWWTIDQTYESWVCDEWWRPELQTPVDKYESSRFPHNWTSTPYGILRHDRLGSLPQVSREPPVIKTVTNAELMISTQRMWLRLSSSQNSLDIHTGCGTTLEAGDWGGESCLWTEITKWLHLCTCNFTTANAYVRVWMWFVTLHCNCLWLWNQEILL